MQKCAVLPGKMQKSGVELGKLKVHVVRARNTRTVAERMLKYWITDDFINLKIDKISSFCQQK